VVVPNTGKIKYPTLPPVKAVHIFVKTQFAQDRTLETLVIGKKTLQIREVVATR
jgi:hypothetical protein